MSTILSNSWSALIGASSDSLHRDAAGPLPTVGHPATTFAPGNPLLSHPSASLLGSHQHNLGRTPASHDDDRSGSSSPSSEAETLHSLLSHKTPSNMNFAAARNFPTQDQMAALPPGLAAQYGGYAMPPNMGMLMPSPSLMHAGGFSTQMPVDMSQHTMKPDHSIGLKSDKEDKSDKADKPEKEKSKSKKKSKKRGRGDSADSSDVSRVRLSREDLLRVSSKELEEFAARCAAERPLSPEEVREIKRQRRLIKNREYAQASRVKKKSHLQEIETRFTDLEEENYNMKLQLQNMQSRLHIAESENRELKLKLAAATSNHVQVQQPPPVVMTSGPVPNQLPTSNVAISASGLGLPSLNSSLGELKFSGGAIGASGFIPDLFSSDGATAPMPAFRPMNSGGV